jgi:DNA-binding transcriptional ArsR family regulator
LKTRARASSAPDPFAAIADGTRRAILDLLLRRGTLTAGEIAAAFPTISRPAVSQHLRVLRESHLVRVDAIGREWHYALDAAAFARVYRDWFAGFAPLWEQSLEALKDRVEAEAARGVAKHARKRRRAS